MRVRTPTFLLTLALAVGTATMASALTIEAESARIRTVGVAGLVFRRDSRRR